MSRLPVIVSAGGMNAAGRSSGHHAYRRMLIDVLDEQDADQTYRSLSRLMGLDVRTALSEEQRRFILEHTLIRRVESQHFDGDRVEWNKRVQLNPLKEDLSFVSPKKHLPKDIPDNWTLTDQGDKVRVDISGETEWLLPNTRVFPVQSAGQLPTGFDPGSYYSSHNHPRGLKMTVYSASDAISSMGIDWEEIQKKVSPDQISVYAGSAMGQLDDAGYGGMMTARNNGKRVTSKQCPLGFHQMHADFVNAYLLGSVGSTGAAQGACASFLYNLRLGINDIRSGAARVVIVGATEAPIIPSVMEGYIAMGALATDAELIALDKELQLEQANHRRACRPFSTNCGFTIAEGSQYVVLFDDELALSTGANILGGVSDVFINADGYKKSISAPGVGNYVTVAKAMAAAKAIVGEEGLRRSYVHAHGTGTPQNRVTESHILNEAAKYFGLDNWLVSAVKSYVGHSIAVAAGDQLSAALGTWQFGWVPGISTIDHVAEDVHHDHLNISAEHTELGAENVDVAIINSKGFGGNNATATLLSPAVVKQMLARKHGKAQVSAYQKSNEVVAENARVYDQEMVSGNVSPLYKFNHGVLGGDDVSFKDGELKLQGYDLSIDLDFASEYDDMI